MKSSYLDVILSSMSRERCKILSSPEWHKNTFTWRRNFGKTWSIDPLLTYRINPFSVFYAGSAVRYTDWSLTEEPPYGPSDWKMSSRQFFVKLQYLFQV